MQMQTHDAESSLGSRIRQGVRSFFMHTVGSSRRRGSERGEMGCESGEEEGERCNWAEADPFNSNVASDSGALVRVRIHRRFIIGPGESPTPLQPSDIDHIYILEGTLSKFFPFSGTTVKWLLDVVRLLFGPYCGGQLYTPPSSCPEWIERVNSPNWILAKPQDRLLAQVYEYVPPQQVALSRISHRTVSSKTSYEAARNARSFLRDVTLRDWVCVLSSISMPEVITASHIIPKRMGDQQTFDIVSQFEPGIVVDGRFDPRLGVLLNRNLNGAFTVYKMGLKHISGETYCVHYFGIPPPPINIVPHGLKITLNDHSSGIPLPPPGLLNWHYLQCVFNYFGTTQFKTMAGIVFYEMPFRTQDDDDEDEDEICTIGSQDEVPYPTYWLDRRAAERAEQREREERMKLVRSWRKGVNT